MQRKDFSQVTNRIAGAIAESASGQGAEESVDHLWSVQAQIDAIARGDLDAAVQNAHPDVRLEIFAPLEFPWIRRATGIEELRRALQQNFRSVEDQQREIASVTAQGSTVVLIGKERGRIKTTGAAYAMQFVERFSFRERRLESVTVIAAHAES